MFTFLSFQVFWAKFSCILCQQHCLSSTFTTRTQNWFSFSEIVQSISLLLQFFRLYFQVVADKFFVNPFLLKPKWFCWIKYFQGWNRRTPCSSFILIVFWIYIIAPSLFINFWLKMRTEPNQNAAVSRLTLK